LQSAKKGKPDTLRYHLMRKNTGTTVEKKGRGNSRRPVEKSNARHGYQQREKRAFGARQSKEKVTLGTTKYANHGGPKETSR